MCVGLLTHVLTSCESIDYEKGTVTFNNGLTITADIIVGADGIRVNIYHSIALDNPLTQLFF